MQTTKTIISIASLTLLVSCASKSNEIPTGANSAITNYGSSSGNASSNYRSVNDSHSSSANGSSSSSVNASTRNGSASGSSVSAVNASGSVSNSSIQNGRTTVVNSTTGNQLGSSSQTSTLQQGSSSSHTKASSASRLSPLGTWSGTDNQERVSIKFGANGSFILNNAAGANPGKWVSSGNGSFHLTVGGSEGEFTMVDSSTASFTSGGASIELKRN